MVLGCVSADGGAALEGWVAVSVATRNDGSHPLSPFPGGWWIQLPSGQWYGGTTDAQMRDSVRDGFTSPGPEPAAALGTGHLGTRGVSPCQSPAATAVRRRSSLNF